MSVSSRSSTDIARAAARFLVVAFAVFAAGCASITGYPKDVIAPDDELATLQPYFAPSVISSYEALSGETARRSYRDNVTYGRMRAYDITFREFEKALARESGGTSLGADLISLTLSGLGATVGGAGTKAALSAASGGVIGAKGDVSKDLFFEKTLPAVVAQMEAQRAKVRASIEAGLAQSDADYSLPKALVDLNLYQAAGSLPGAVSGIVQSAGTTTAQAERDIKFTREQSFTAQLTTFVSQRDRIKALTDSQALSLAKAMEQYLPTRPSAVQDFVKGSDPDNKRLTDGSVARQLLMRWIVMDDRTPATQQQWSDAIDAAAQ